MDANSRADRQDYAAALRVIGQELADLLPLNLEIEVKEDNFVVRGKGLPESSQSNATKRNILSKVWNALIHRDPATDLVDWQLKSVPFIRTYSQEAISRWDDTHLKKRKRTADLPDIYSLGERLRIIGRIVNAKGGDLVHLTKTLNSVAFQYRDPEGVIHSEEYNADDLFRIQQEYYSNRET
jgi:hypothetical protein